MKLVRFSATKRFRLVVKLLKKRNHLIKPERRKLEDSDRNSFWKSVDVRGARETWQSVLGGSGRKFANIAGCNRCICKTSYPVVRLKRWRCKAVIVRTKSGACRKDGSYIKWRKCCGNYPWRQNSRELVSSVLLHVEFKDGGQEGRITLPQKYFLIKNKTSPLIYLRRPLRA